MGFLLDVGMGLGAIASHKNIILVLGDQVISTAQPPSTQPWSDQAMFSLTPPPLGDRIAETIYLHFHDTAVGENFPYDQL